MKYSNVFVIAVLVSVFAAGFVCIADDAEAAPSNSGEAFVEDINTLLKGSVGEDIASATYTEGVVEILVDPSYTSLVALVDTAELKANAYQTFITYETFYLDGVYYVSSYIPDVDNGVNAALRIVGEMQDKLCSAQPGTITVFESSDFSVNKDGYDAFSGSLVVKVVADQDDIDFAKFASEYVQVDSESGQIYFTICFYGIDRNQSMGNIVDTVATMTADEFFLGNVNSGKVNTLCEQLIKYPGAVNSVAFIWENDGEIYSVAVDGFQPGEGKDAFQKLVAGISNSKAILPGLKDGWNEPVKTFQEPITGKYFVDDGAAVANYYVGNGTVVVLKALFDATVTPGYRNSGMAFVDDMNRFFEESGLDKVASGVYTDECLKFNFDYSAIYDRTVDININQTVEAMAKEILTSYDLFSINGVDYVVDGKPVTSAAHQLMYIVAGMADTVRKATPGDTELFLSDSFSVKKNLWDQYDGAISLSTTLDQFAIDAANYVSQFISVDPETLTISVRGYIYGLSEDYNASDLAFIYSHVNAKQLFEQKYVDYINWGCDMLMDEGAQFAPYFSIVWNINGVDYKLSLNEFTPGEGKDAFQKLAAGIYDSINSAPAGYSNGWEVPVKDFYVSPAYYVADGLGVMSVPGYPEFAVPVHGELALLDRPFDITILAPEHAVIIIVPHIDPIRVPVVVIPEPGYVVEDIIVVIDGVPHNITEDGYFELTGDAVVSANVQPIPPEPVHVTSVILNKESIDLVVGKTAFLQATVLPANATDKAVTWSSSNPAVASVDANGKVTAKSVGTAIITVTTVDGGFTDSCIVNVLEYIPVESMTLNITSATIDVGEYVVLIPKFLPQGASDTVVWTSSNTNVATVSYGVVWGVSYGHAVITATTVKEGISATCDIYVSGGEIHVTGVTLNTESATVDVGKSISLFATVVPANATNKAVTWSTSDASVATVNNGVVTGVAVGNATITVTTVDGGYTASCQVTVVYTPVTGVTLDKSKIDMKVGEVASVVATVAPANATNKAVNWSTSNASVATVNNGLVSAVGAGTAIITVTTVDGGFKATCEVNVTEPGPAVIHVTGVTLDQTSKTISLTDEFTLTATVLPANATNKAVIWSTSDASVATVVDGLVRGVGVGNATITVTTVDGGFKATCDVTVSGIRVTGVTVGPTSTEVVVGSTVTLIATVIPADATNQNVTWSTSDSSVASVDKNGVVTGIAVGTAKVTVTTEDGGYTATCDVTVVESKVVPVTGVSLSKTTLSLKTGESATLTATVIPSDATNKNITWSTSNSKVATVSDGVVKAVAEGTATITVTTEDGSHTATCTVTVTPAQPAPASDNTLLYVGIAAAIIIVILVAAFLMRKS